MLLHVKLEVMLVMVMQLVQMFCEKVKEIVMVRRIKRVNGFGGIFVCLINY